MSEETIKWMGIQIPKYKALDFDTFKTKSKDFGIPLFNNFFLYFIDVIYEKSPVFKKFQQEHPDLSIKAKEIITKSSNKRGSPEWIDEVSPVLYEAYKIMKGYTIDGRLTSNYPDLFG